MHAKNAIGALVAVAANMLLLTGCSGSVAADEIETKVKDQLTKTIGQEPDSIDCPDDLKAEVGATTRCVLTEGADKIGVTVTVKSVDGDNAQMDIQVDDKKQDDGSQPAEPGESQPADPTEAPTPDAGDTGGSGVKVPNHVLAEEVKRKISAQIGETAVVLCPDALPGKVGATTECTYNEAGKTYGVQVTVTSVNGTTVGFDAKVDSTPK